MERLRSLLAAAVVDAVGSQRSRRLNGVGKLEGNGWGANKEMMKTERMKLIGRRLELSRYRTKSNFLRKGYISDTVDGVRQKRGQMAV
jgi:hypothetical protein